MINGITPADAGKTSAAIFCILAARDHPRGCGENGNIPCFLPAQYGSPPRMRGKPVKSLRKLKKVRITPADAGKTEFLEQPRCIAEDHPRGCGENTPSAWLQS